jgi:23S rRNA (cytidine1920-2'-O)/16S rRNA (cytidine1409-2'-O)-methyltransferase
VLAVDVGHGQLHPRIRHDARVFVLERTNIRDFVADPPVDVVVADLSFISLTRVVGPLLASCRDGGDLVLLVKPQFEAGRQEVNRGSGVIRDPAVHERVLAEVAASLVDAGADIVGWVRSPITGADGNVEFLVHARRTGVRRANLPT